MQPASKPSTSTKSVAVDKAFTQNWLQSLTLVAQNTTAQKIKPLFNSIDDLCRASTDADRMESAKRLWDFSSSVGLQNLLFLVPAQQSVWELDPSDLFTFERSSIQPIADFEAWTKCIGIQPGDFKLHAGVVSAEWSSLIRREAVKLHRAFNTSTFPQGKNLQLPCTALWDLKHWSIRFDDVDWIVLPFEEPFTVQRPLMSDIEEILTWSIATANDSLIPKTVAKCPAATPNALWTECVPRLQALHEQVLETASGFSPWLKRVWSCVWPIVYREQNKLRGLAELDVIRQELAACMSTVPQLTLWNCVFAKLVCQAQTSWGLGICGTYRD